MKTGFMTPLPELGIPYNVPVIFNGFLAGGSGINGLKFALVQAVNLIICTVLYYPFFRLMDKAALKEEQDESNGVVNQ
ncbi:Lichenan permease IIC component [compost metagenome]